MTESSVFSKMSGTKDVVRFVKEIERHPCLYDQKSPLYSNRELKRRTWIEIAKKANSTVNDCKNKWVKLRIAYLRTLSPKYNRSRTNRTPYYLADHLKFIKPATNASNYSQSNQSSTEDSYEVGEKNEIDANTVDDQSNDWDEDCFDDDEETANDSETTIDRKEGILSEINETIHIKEARNECNSREVEKNRPCCDKIECNPRKMFLLSLLPDIERLTETQMRTFRRQVIQFIDNVLDE